MSLIQSPEEKIRELEFSLDGYYRERVAQQKKINELEEKVVVLQAAGKTTETNRSYLEAKLAKAMKIVEKAMDIDCACISDCYCCTQKLAAWKTKSNKTLAELSEKGEQHERV